MILHVQDTLRIDFELTIGERFGSRLRGRRRPSAEYRVANMSAPLSTVLSSTNIPLNGRSFQTLIALTPGVVLTATSQNDQGQFSVNGQRADANYFTVDGVSANFGVTGALNAGSDCGRGITGAQRFGRDEQSGIRRCDARVSRSNVFVCAGVWTHSRRTDLDRDALRHQCFSRHIIRVLQERRARRHEIGL